MPYPCLSGHSWEVEYWCQRQLISLKIHTLLKAGIHLYFIIRGH